MIVIKGIYNEDGTTKLTIHDDSYEDLVEFYKIMAVQKFHLGTEFGPAEEDDFINCLIHNFTNYEWQLGPHVLCMNGIGQQVESACFWGTSEEKIFQVACFARENILVQIDARNWKPEKTL